MPDTALALPPLVVAAAGDRLQVKRADTVLLDLDMEQATALAHDLTAFSWGTGPEPVVTPNEAQEDVAGAVQLLTVLDATLALARVPPETKGIPGRALELLTPLLEALERAAKARRPRPAAPPTVQVFGTRADGDPWFALTQPTPVEEEEEYHVSVKLPGAIHTIGVEVQPGLKPELVGHLLGDEERAAAYDTLDAVRGLLAASDEKGLLEAVEEVLSSSADLNVELVGRVGRIVFGEDDEDDGEAGEGETDQEAGGEAAPAEAEEEPGPAA